MKDPLCGGRGELVVNKEGVYTLLFSLINFSSFLRNMKFTVYSKDGCPYCEKVKQVLELTKLQHVVYNLGEDFTREQFYAEFGEGSTFPQVICDDKKLGGSVDTIKFLKENQIV